MTRTVSTGRQQFDVMIEKNNFYVDKTKFIEEWWKDDKGVTLITRPRRFGKTLMMSTVKCFFSSRYKDRKDLFDGLYIGTCSDMMKLQGAIPVVYLSFSDCKDDEDYEGKKIQGYIGMVEAIKEEIRKLYRQFSELLERKEIKKKKKTKFAIIRDSYDPKEFTTALMNNSIQFLCELICRCYGIKPIILLDEYDTPLQEAYASGYWGRLVKTMRAFFNKSFKTTDFFQRALITGIAKV